MAIALEIYEALRSVGVEDAKAKSTAQKFDQAMESRLTREVERLATREDVASIRREMATREDLAREIGQLRAELHDMIGKLRADMIKWMFLFWVGQQAVLLGILFAFFK